MESNRIHTDESGYVAIVTAMVSVVVAAGLIQISVQSVVQESETQARNRMINNTAQLQNSFFSAMTDFIEDKQSGWSVGSRHTIDQSTLEPDYLVNGFGDGGETPFGQQFKALAIKRSDTVQAVVFQTGSMDDDAVGSIGLEKTDQTVRSLAFQIQQTFLDRYATGSKVPAVVRGGTQIADGGDLFSVDISEFLSTPPGRARSVGLYNFPGLIESTRSLPDHLEEYHQFMNEMRRSYVQVRHCDSWGGDCDVGTRSSLTTQTPAKIGMVGDVDNSDAFYVRVHTPNSSLRNKQICLWWGDNDSFDKKRCGTIKNGWVGVGTAGNVDDNDVFGVELEGGFSGPLSNLHTGIIASACPPPRQTAYASVNHRADISLTCGSMNSDDWFGVDLYLHDVSPADFAN